MIYLFNAANRDAYGGYLLDMHKQRHDIFVKTRGWHELDNFFGYEVDQYDSRLATYLLCIDNGRVLGGVRIMPTTFGTFLGESYGHLLKPGAYEPSLRVWEMYRLFVTDSDWLSESGHPARREIMLMMIEYLHNQGVEKVVAVTDSSLPEQLPPWWKWREIGERSTFQQAGAGDGECALVEIDISAEMIAANRKFLKFNDDCLMKAEDGLEPRPSVITPEDMILLHKWLETNPEHIRSTREIVENADKSPSDAQKYKQAVLGAIEGAFGTQPEGSIPVVGKFH